MRILVSSILFTVAIQSGSAQAGDIELYKVMSEGVDQLGHSPDLNLPTAHHCSESIHRPSFSDDTPLFTGGTSALAVDFKSKCVW